MLNKILAAFFALVLIVVAAMTLVIQRANYEPPAVRPIGKLATHTPYWDNDFLPAPVAGSIPAHPFLAAPGAASMHADGFQSDVHPAFGPSGVNIEVRTRRAGGKIARMCPTYLFRRDGNIVVMCGGIFGFYLGLIDPQTLERLASYKLPMRPSSFQAIVKRDPSINFGDSSGGAYLLLDNEERILLADSRQILQRIAIDRSAEGQYAFRQETAWDLRAHVPNNCLHYNNLFPRGECDMITTIMPDHDGRYWWVTRYGRVGVLDPETGEVFVHRLEGEEIQNAIAADENGIYILSDHALYAFRAQGNGAPEMLWREEYDRGNGRKIGSINQGSGTTPTLVGKDYITFADNADPRINLIVLKRGEIANGAPRMVCSVPVFDPGASATDNSMIAFGRSIILENNSGYTNGYSHTDWNAMAGGVVRIDIREDETGCDVIWTNDIVVPSVVPKLSTANGIAYFYTFDLTDDGEQLWSLAGLDFETGKLVLKVPTGQGAGFNNNWASIAIAPDGSAYVGSMQGTIQIRTKR